MAVRGIGLEAQNANPPVRTQQIGERRQLLLCGLGGQVREKDVAHLGMSAGACRRAPIDGRPESAEVQVVDADAAEVRGEGRLREAGAARHRDGADVDEELDVGGRERVEKVADRGALIADRGKAMHTEV